MMSKLFSDHLLYLYAHALIILFIVFEFISFFINC